MEEKVLEILERNFNESIEFDRNKAAEELLILFGVSQQRELLLAYHRYLTKELSLDLHELWVDEHLNRVVELSSMKAIDTTGVEGIPDPYWEEYIRGKQ